MRILRIILTVLFVVFIVTPSRGRINSQQFSLTRFEARDHKDWDILISRTRGMVVSHLLLQRSETEFCVLDVRGRDKLVPFFVPLAGRNFHSSLYLEELSVCHLEEEAFLQASAEKSVPGDSGVQVAAAVAVPVAASVITGFGRAVGVGTLLSGAVGCGFGIFGADKDSLTVGEALVVLEQENVMTSGEVQEFRQFMSGFEGFENLHFNSFFDSALVTPFVGSHSVLFSSARSFLKSTRALFTAVSASIIGIFGFATGLLSGSIGALTCENGVHYLFEKNLVDEGSLYMDKTYETLNETGQSVYDKLNRAYDALEDITLGE